MKYKIVTLLFALSFTLVGFAQALKPKSYTQWVTKSADYMELNMLDSAEYALNQSIMNDPDNENNTWLMTSLGTIQQHLGKYDAAYMSLTSALSKHPKSVFILHQRAALLKDMERWDEAKADYNAILSVDSLDIEALYNRGVLKLDVKDRTGAEKDFAIAEENGDLSPYGLMGKALIYRLDGNWEEAEKTYNIILNSYPDMTNLYLKRAECYLHLNQLSKLSADLQTVASIEFDNPMYYFLRGQMRLKQFDKMAAQSDFEKARDLGMEKDLLHPWIQKAK